MQSEFQKSDETQTDVELIKLLGSLDRVSAPTDFGVRVRARVAARRSSGSARPYGWLVRIGAPITAMLALFAFIWYFSSEVQDAGSVAVAEPEPQFVLPVNEMRPATSAANTSTEFSPREIERAATTPARPNKVNVPTRIESNDGRGSIDFSVRPGNVSRPRTDVNIRAARNAEFERSATIPVSGVLSDLGIEASAESGKWVVRSIRANSLADRSGLLAGDVIEAIDEKPVAPDTVFVKSAEGKAITVTRKGSRLVIPLK